MSPFRQLGVVLEDFQIILNSQCSKRGQTIFFLLNIYYSCRQNMNIILFLIWGFVTWILSLCTLSTESLSTPQLLPPSSQPPSHEFMTFSFINFLDDQWFGISGIYKCQYYNSLDLLLWELCFLHLNPSIHIYWFSYHTYMHAYMHPCIQFDWIPSCQRDEVIVGMLWGLNALSPVKIMQECL